MSHYIGDIQQSVQSNIWGNKFIGNYEIKSKIGEGSYSSVFLAEHVMTQHTVVLKSADKNQTNLAAEIANMSLLDHPNVVRLYEYIVMPDKVWLVLEFCGGKELFNYLVQSRVIPPWRTVRMFAQLAAAVTYVHQLNCAHRDLKLENVMLDDNGNVKLCDFGFARNYRPRTMLETVCGTESYMAPELILRRKYIPEAADVWSLGVILYAMLYGRLPFDEEAVPDTVRNIVERDPDFQAIGDDENLVSIVKQMLHKNPHQRPKLIDILDMLGEHGKTQKQLLARKQKEATPPMSSKQERRMLKGMKALNIDLHELADSVVKHKCDVLHGLWYTALDCQKICTKPRPSVVSVQSVQSMHSMLSLSSHKSQRHAHPALPPAPSLSHAMAAPSLGSAAVSPLSRSRAASVAYTSASQLPEIQTEPKQSVSRKTLGKVISIFKRKDERVKKVHLETPQVPETAETEAASLTPQSNSAPRFRSASPLLQTPIKKGLGVQGVARPTSIYSQSSQLSQMSQSSVEASLILAEVQEKFSPNTVGRKYAGLAPSLISSTPPGTPISRQRIRLNITDSMPSKIEEDDIY